MKQFEINAGEQVFARQMPGKAKEFAQVHFKADFLSATPAREEELHAILSFQRERHSFSPPKIGNIQFLFSLWGSANAGNVSFSMFWRVIIWTFQIGLIPNFHVLLSYPRGTCPFFQNKPFIDLTLCLIPEDMQRRVFHLLRLC